VAFAGGRGLPQVPKTYLLGKRVFDVSVAFAALPVVVIVSIVLLALNPIWNRGPLFFAQKRMGRNCRPFRALKFRTMAHSPEIARGPDDPLETDRITRLGHFLRRTRIDEIPQFLNVLTGQMSLIGPRPDYWDHAIHYVDTIAGYRQRHSVRPGITGLAQVDGGYAEGIQATMLKTHHDLRYLETLGPGTDWYILRRTVTVVLSGWGAR
jgi:lipopolysaccharide/colanic/teichoic acid biosynthesis glycosyltransferase